DQRKLFPPGPPFELLLPSDGVPCLTRGFHMDQPRGGMAKDVPVGVGAFAVLRYPADQVVGDADVELAGLAGENVDVERPARHAARWGGSLNGSSSEAPATSL